MHFYGRKHLLACAKFDIYHIIWTPHWMTGCRNWGKEQRILSWKVLTHPSFFRCHSTTMSHCVPDLSFRIHEGACFLQFHENWWNSQHEAELEVCHRILQNCWVVCTIPLQLPLHYTIALLVKSYFIPLFFACPPAANAYAAVYTPLDEVQKVIKTKQYQLAIIGHNDRNWGWMKWTDRSQKRRQDNMTLHCCKCVARKSVGKTYCVTGNRNCNECC